MKMSLIYGVYFPSGNRSFYPWKFQPLDVLPLGRFELQKSTQPVLYPITGILQCYILLQTSNEINPSAKVIERKHIYTLEKEQSKTCIFCMQYSY